MYFAMLAAWSELFKQYIGYTEQPRPLQCMYRCTNKLNDSFTNDGTSTAPCTQCWALSLPYVLSRTYRDHS